MSIILSSIQEASGFLEWMLSVRNQGSESWKWTTWCINQCGWKHRWWTHWVYVGPYLWSKQASHGYCKPDIMHLIGLAARVMRDLSRIWCQMCLTLPAKLSLSMLRISMHDKVNMSTSLWHLDRSISWRNYMRFWNQDHSASSSKYIRFWNLDHSAGWRQLEAFHVRCQRRIIVLVWHDFVSNEEVRNKNSTCPARWDNSEATCLPLLQIARLGREVQENQAQRIAIDVRGMVWLSWSSWLQRITADTVKYLRTAFVDDVDRGHATGAIFHAKHTALNYWIASTCSKAMEKYPIESRGWWSHALLTFCAWLEMVVFINQTFKQHIYISWPLRPTLIAYYLVKKTFGIIYLFKFGKFRQSQSVVILT